MKVFGKRVFKAGGEDMGDSSPLSYMEIFGKLLYMWSSLPFLDNSSAVAGHLDPQHSGLAHASQDNLMSALYSV